MKLQLGINTCFAVKRWPEPQSWLQIVHNELGLDYVEFDLDLLDPLLISNKPRQKTCQEIKQIAKELGITIFTTCTGEASHRFNMLGHPRVGFRRDALRWCEASIFLSAQLGAQGINGNYNAFSERDLANTDRKSLLITNLIKSLQHLSRVAADADLKFILWEQMYTPSEIPYTFEEVEELFEKINQNTLVPILMCIDLGHTCCSELSDEERNPYSWLRKYAHRSPVIHLQQTDGLVSRHWPFTDEYNQQGIIEGSKVIDAIEASGASEVVLMLEIFHPINESSKKVLEELKKSVDYWRDVIL